MKTLSIYLVLLCVILACEQAPKQYFSSSPEIELAKKNTNNYYSGSWDEMKVNYNDTAKIYHNSTDPISVDKMIARFRDGLKDVSSYTSKDSIYYEMIIEDDGDHWVNMWATWKGSFKGIDKEIEVPYHITAKIKDGKIIEEYGYWNHLPIYLGLKEVHMKKDSLNNTSE